MLHNGLKYCAVLATMALISAAACSDDETTNPTGATTTTTTGGGGGNDTVAQCTEACNTLYDCGLEEAGGDQLCPGFTGVAAEKTGFVGDETGGCVANCIGLTALINLVDGEDCPGTISNISGANMTFANVCENGFSQGGGGAGGTGGSGGAGGAGGAGGGGGA